MTTAQSTATPSRLKRLSRTLSQGWRRLIEPHPSVQDPGTRRQVQLLSAFLLALLMLITLGAIAGLAVRGFEISSIIQVVLAAMLVVAYWLSRTPRHQAAAVLTVFILAATAYVSILTTPDRASGIIYSYLPIAFVVASFLLSTRAATVFVAVNVIIIFCLPLVLPQYLFRDAGTDGGIMLTLGAIVIIFSFVRNLVERDRLAVLNQANTELRDLRDTLEQRVEARTDQLRASAEVGQAAAAILDPVQLLRRITTLISERFGFYYAAVFMLNEEGTAAALHEATGEAGRILKERQHRLDLSQPSMVGYAVKQRKARIALDVGTDPVRFANPLLPDTRSEIALPLITGDRVLGALDVQSTEAAAFDEASAAVLQSMADQIAVALNNAEQFRRTQLQAERQRELNQFGRALFSATSMENLYRTLATGLRAVLPHDYLSLILAQGAALREYQLQAEGEQVVLDGPVYAMQTTLCGRVFTTRHLAISNNLADDARLEDAAQLDRLGYRSALSMPLNIGERILGTLNLASRSAAAFPQENAAWFEQLAGQISAALETQRLAEAQQASLREMEVLTRQLSGQAWAKRRQRRSEEVVHYARSGSAAELQPATPELEAAIVQQAPLARSQPDDADPASPYQAAMAVPIVLRGEVLGGLQVSETNRSREWTEDDLTFMQAVADQVALALDNARLIEETQQRAERERLVADVSSRMFAANDLESIVHIAGEELGRILQVKQTTVKVHAEPAEMSPQPGNGQSPDQHA
jgi:GAF domain-containing protein